MDMDDFRLSVVVPLYNEEIVLPIFMEELRAETALYGDVEVILVDDGSSDSTPDIIKDLAETSPEVKYIRFSRNYGHQIALLAGLEAASGDCVVMMDGDLQHPPSMIRDLVAKWREGYHIVNTIREGGEDIGLFKKLTASAFYYILNKVADGQVTPNAADFRLLDRKALDAVLSFRERHPYFRGIVDSIGFRKTTVPYFAAARGGGETKYSLKKMAKLALDGLFYFSEFPMRFFIVSGLTLLTFDTLYVCYIIYVWLVGGVIVSGWASLIGLIILLTGLTIISFGILGGYVYRIFEEMRGRPKYITLESNLGGASEEEVPERRKFERSNTLSGMSRRRG